MHMPSLSGLGKRTLVMGILNVTPDSFSDGGKYFDVESALSHALQMVEDGADIIDIGGESTRPATFCDQAPLPEDDEIARVRPVIERLCAQRATVPISIDTYKARVAQEAVSAGAGIVNDISGLTYDPSNAGVAANAGVPLVLMHLPGQPRNLPAKPHYNDLIGDIKAFFERQIAVAESFGLHASSIILDPGVGFGKSAAQNFEILRRLPELKAMGFPLLLGTSRKRFIGSVLGDVPPSDRVEGTAATVAISILGGADIVRVHDVKEMARVAKVSDAVVYGIADDA
jgi:dihydropteroate synthase